MQPFLREFLYALSAGDGADPTRASDAGADPARNGEPEAELGVVIQKDFAWQDQTGAPSDPQAGNIPGGPRDVLRSADFNDGTANNLFADSGVWTVESGKLQVSAESIGGDAVSVMHLEDPLPTYFEITATITMVKPTGGWKANAYVIYDYYSPDDFKFAGIDASRDKIQMGHRTAEGWIIDAETPNKIKPGNYYNVLVAVNGTNVTVRVDGTEYFTHTYEARVDPDGWVHGLNEGMVGLGSDNSRGTYDNIAVQVLPPEYTFQATEDFEDAEVEFLNVPQSGVWEMLDGRYDGTPFESDRAVSLFDIGMTSGLAANSILEIDVTVNTDATTGIVFDYYGPDDFKYAGLSADSDALIIGHFIKGQWVVDASFDYDVEAGIDYEMSLSLKGTTVDVALKTAGAENWQAMVGYLFNAVTVDGSFGLLAKEGAASFDTVTIKTNDPFFIEESQSLLAASALGAVDPGAVLTQSQLTPIVDEAIARWVAALGDDAAAAALLNEVNVEIADFGDLTLGQTSGTTVRIDDDAAGHGWFVDSTPADDSEFRHSRAKPASDGYGDMDLLTVVLHEFGHVLGLDDLYSAAEDDTLMSASLDTGERFVPDSADLGDDSSEPLVNLDVPVEPEPIAAAGGVPHSSWLTTWLTRGTEDDDSDGPNSDIQLIIQDEEEDV
jgi:hypothetical protein